MIPFLPEGTLTGLALDGFLSGAECDALAARLTAAGFAATGRAYPAGYRDNDRVVLDDPRLAARWWDLLSPRLPGSLLVDGVRWIPEGLNVRFRGCRYADGQSFTIHRDGAHAPARGHRSLFTLQLYLNDASGFAGGRTRFYADAMGAVEWAAVVPRQGLAILFDHRAWHDGEAVTRGTKLVLRTDVMCRAAEPVALEDRDAIGGHPGYVWRVLERRDGSIASSGRDGHVRIWSGAPRAVALGHGSVMALAEDRAGRLWCGTRSGHVAVIDGAGARWVAQLDAAVLDAACPDGEGVALALASGELARLDGSGALAWRRPVHAGWTWAVRSAGPQLLTCGDDGAVCVTDDAGRVTVLTRLPVALRALALDGGTLLAGDAAGAVHVLDAGGRPQVHLAAHGAACTALAARGGVWASGGEDGAVHLWRGEARLRSHASRDFVRSVAFTRAGELLAAGYDGAIRRWPATSTSSPSSPSPSFRPCP